MGDLIIVYNTKGEWKLQLSAEISFVSQKSGSDETRVMYTRSFCEEIMSGSETEEITEKLIMSLLQKYQDNLQNKMKGSDFMFNAVNYLFYDFNRITISKGRSYIESPKWLKDKKCTINQKNNDKKCFQYATTLALNFNKIDKHPQRISKIKPFIDNYNWNDINFPTAKKDWNRFELNNKDVALDILYVPFKKIDTSQNNPDLSSTTKINQHIPSGYSIYTSCSFDKSNNKLSYYRGEDCMKRFCKDLKDHATKLIDFKKKIMTPLTKEEEDNYNKENICYICKKEFNNDKVRDHCHFTGKYRGAAHNTCHLRYKIPKNIPVIFHNGSTYDYHFIIKELACEFEGNFECLGENTEKYITFSVPIKKRIENKNMDITYKIKFIDSFRFMATSLSKLVDNLTDDIHNDKCVKCKSNLCFVNAMNETLLFKCIDCEKEYEKEFHNPI